MGYLKIINGYPFNVCEKYPLPQPRRLARAVHGRGVGVGAAIQGVRAAVRKDHAQLVDA